MGVRVRRRIEIDQGMARPLENGRRERRFCVLKERTLTAEPRHHDAREERTDQEPPSPAVPPRVIKLLPRLASAQAKKIGNRFAIVD